MKKVDILETTLRDGSYAVNFSFTSADTSIICKELEEAGFEYIEIGHGVGLNASKRGYGQAAQSDEEYMIGAESVLKKAKYGMFCIPGIARLEDIDLAVKHNMGFIRIGTNATEVHKSQEYIKKAKDCGLYVATNFMKSYVLSPNKFAEKVKLSEEYGADMVYLVDSAGGMFAESIRRYYKAIRKVTDITLGFHGHDNLGMAISNSVEAVREGFRFVDASLQGLGRSAGNAPTEVLIAALLKLGYKMKYDFLKVLDIGQQYIQPLLTIKGRMPLDVVAGYAEFHSSYMHHIHKYASRYRVNPMVLIIEMSKKDKVYVDDTVLEKVAQKIKAEKEFYLGKYNFNRYIGREQDGRRG